MVELFPRLLGKNIFLYYINYVIISKYKKHITTCVSYLNSVMYFVQ